MQSHNQNNALTIALNNFIDADTIQSLGVAVKQNPIMRDPRFIKAIEALIENDVPIEHKPTFVQRLTWLKQIIQK